MLLKFQMPDDESQQWLADFEADILQCKSSKLTTRWQQLLEDFAMMGVSDPTQPCEFISDMLKFNQDVWKLLTKYKVVNGLKRALIRDLKKIYHYRSDGTPQVYTKTFSSATHACGLLEHFLIGDSWRTEKE
jgi:hypothetical protein